MTPREEFEKQFGSINDDEWQWLKEFTDRNYDANDWRRGIIGYKDTQTGDIYHPDNIEIIRGDDSTNHRELLIKYIVHVGNCEGINFLADHYKNMDVDDDAYRFSDEEWAELQKLKVEPLTGQKEDDSTVTETARAEYDRLIKLPFHDQKQSVRVRHLKHHLDLGDVLCNCPEPIGQPVSSIRGW